MKKYQFLLFIFCFTIGSCSKINSDRTNEIETYELGISPTVINGTLSFNTLEELHNAINFLANISLEEQKAWEEKNGFYSIKRRVFEGFDAIHKANQKESLTDLNNALQEYKDVIAENDTSYFEIYPSTPYQYICNRNGLYISSNHVFKVTPEEIEVYNFDDLNDLNLGIKIEPVRKYGNYYHRYKTETKARYDSDLIGEYYDNPSGCKHDRRCYVELSDVAIYLDGTCTDSLGYEYSQMVGTVYVSVRAWGSERNWLCKWSDYYRTLLAWRNVSFNVNVFDNIYDQQWPIVLCSTPNTNSTIVQYAGTIPDYAPPNDETEIMRIVNAGDAIVNENSTFDLLVTNYLGFISAHAEATSRGIIYFENWAIIDL